MPKVNWASVEEQDFSPIPEGQYLVEVESIAEKETTKGDEMWSVKFNIVGEKYAGRKLFTNLVFNEGGYGNIKKLYSAIYGTKLPKNCQPTDLEGEKVLVDVEISEYKGKKNNSIPYAGYYAVEETDEEFI